MATRYTLRFDDEPETEINDFAQFCFENDLDTPDMDALAALTVGGEYAFGGGAGPLAVVRRVA